MTESSFTTQMSMPDCIGSVAKDPVVGTDVKRLAEVAAALSSLRNRGALKM